MSENNAIVLRTGGDFLVPAAPLQTMIATYQAKKDFIGAVLAEGVDYGKIPGAGDKPALFKAGAEKMTSFFGLAPQFEDIHAVEDWTGIDHNGEPFFYYRQRCKLYRGDRLIGTAEGSCNSWEKKYRYRSASRVCPACGKATIISGKQEYGGGYICFAKKGGCGAKFKTGDQSIEGQVLGDVKNPDIADQVNTILKMAQKRALVAAVLIATNISDYFTQDIEDYTDRPIVEPVVEKAIPAKFEPAPTAQPEPAPDEAPKLPDVTIEEARAMTTSKGQVYGEMTMPALAKMTSAIWTKLNSGELNAEETAQYLRKAAAIKLLLEQK